MTWELICAAVGIAALVVLIARWRVIAWPERLAYVAAFCFAWSAAYPAFPVAIMLWAVGL